MIFILLIIFLLKNQLSKIYLLNYHKKYLDLPENLIAIQLFRSF